MVKSVYKVRGKTGFPATVKKYKEDYPSNDQNRSTERQGNGFEK
jgi:hypothetical protein